MEINKYQPNENIQELIKQSSLQQGSQPWITWVLIKTQKQARRWETFKVEKKGRLQVCPSWLEIDDRLASPGWLLQIMSSFTGLIAAGWGSELYFYVWPGHCVFIYSVFPNWRLNILLNGYRVLSFTWQRVLKMDPFLRIHNQIGSHPILSTPSEDFEQFISNLYEEMSYW